MNDQDTPSKRRRREHSPMFKRELVARSLVPGASVAAVALEAGINFKPGMVLKSLAACRKGSSPRPTEVAPEKWSS